MQVIFNVNPVITGNSIPEPSQDVIEASFNLDRASVEDALRYGGPITTQALAAMNLRHDRKHIVVDTKVALLLPGMYPAIPGWHTDGVPRGEEKNPAGTGLPFLKAQMDPDIRGPRYHLLVTGTHCPTLFMKNPHEFDVDIEMNSNLYKDLSRQAREQMKSFEYFATEPSTVYEWDWWNIHTAQKATARGWRYLIRVTETDHVVPNTKLDKVIRKQTQVYAPIEFGW